MKKTAKVAIILIVVLIVIIVLFFLSEDKKYFSRVVMSVIILGGIALAIMPGIRRKDINEKQDERDLPTPRFNQYDCIILKKDVEVLNTRSGGMSGSPILGYLMMENVQPVFLPANTKGTITEVLSKPDMPISYEIEFFNNKKNVIVVSILEEDKTLFEFFKEQEHYEEKN